MDEGEYVTDVKMCASSIYLFLLNLLVNYDKQEICSVCRIWDYVNQVFRLGIVVLEYKYAIK